MQDVVKGAARSRRARWPFAVVAVVAAFGLAACGSSSSSILDAQRVLGERFNLIQCCIELKQQGDYKTRLNGYVIPKNLGNNYFTVADSVKTGGALAALQTLGEKGSETSGSAATSASQLPAIQASIAKGANALIVLATVRRRCVRR